MITRILSAATPQESAVAVSAAVDLLRAGEVVALPTETVYGLAANALDADAALKIFEAKERPHFDPLIVHLPDKDWLARVAIIPERSRDFVERLAREFWPGPLTIVLPRQGILPDVVTSGLETVAVRISAHPVLSAVLRAFGGPLAAPSANRFGRISPTAAEHVNAELRDRIPLIIDGGATPHGLESTIVAVRGARIEVLRPGPVTADQLAAIAPAAPPSKSPQMQAPGQLASHYAPRTRLILTRDLASVSVPQNARVGALSWSAVALAGFAETRTLSPSRNLREAAANLFRCLRELDEAGLDLIFAEEVPETGLGTAINDRLSRAAAAR